MASGSTVQAGAILPEDIVRIFGFGRSGSSWLRSLLTDPEVLSPYERPTDPTLTLETSRIGVESATAQILRTLDVC